MEVSVARRGSPADLTFVGSVTRTVDASSKRPDANPMTDRPGYSRRYSEREFAMILRKASELQETGDHPPRASEGLSLPEIQQIAEEAGIDPGLIARAAGLVDQGGDGVRGSLWFGPSPTLHLNAWLDGELSTEDLSRMMDLIRYEVTQPGTVHEVLGSVMWKSESTETGLEVRFTPRDGRTHIEVLSDHRVIRTAFYVAGGMAGFLATMVTLKVLGLPKPIMFFGGLGVGPVLGMLGSRALWSAYAKRLSTSVAKLIGVLEEDAERHVLPESTSD
jgi:hypothetical protein